MKFCKELRAQMVPEWQEAYINYKLLKSKIKEIKIFKQKNTSAAERPHGLLRSKTLYRAFSGLTQMVHSPRGHHQHHGHGSSDVENQVILVSNVLRDGYERSETMFLHASEEGGEYELHYFNRLDEEFNKVVQFYIGKAAEVMAEAEELSKQMNALVAFRVKVENPNGWANSLAETTKLATDTAASRAALSANTPSTIRASRRLPMDIIDEESLRSNAQSEEQAGIEKEEDEEIKGATDKEEEDKKNGFVEDKPASIEILQNVKLNSTQATPRSAIKGLLNIPKQRDLKFSKYNLRKAEDQLKKAFLQFYQKLRFLKNYSFLNVLAFSKIMKKYDKVSSRHASKPYMKMVDGSYLGSSDEVSKLIERVEVIFVKHFSNSNRSKGMNILRPKSRRDRHRVTFSSGFLVGCTMALIIALILVVRARNILDAEGTNVYMDTMFPLYSLFGFVVLHVLLYSGNIYFWRRYRVNYTFIFGFKEETALGYREVMLIAFSISTLAFACVLANLDMEMDPVTKDYVAVTELLPLGLVVLLLLIMLCPFNILYRSSRFFLIVCLFHCLLAPLYNVTLPDFLLADQFTSQVQALRSLEFYICYYGWGDFKHRENNCDSSDVFKTFSFIVAAIPYTWRLMQCLRRLYDEKDVIHAYNGLKYFSTIIAVSARTAYTVSHANSWKIIAWAASIIATIVSTYWDIVLDWGFFQKHSKNMFLRDKLLVPYKSVYHIAMVLNILLRLAWMQTVMNITVFSLHRQTMITIVAALEIIRRGIWNFFRLENEHLNNVGKYRAFTSVPLPFNYNEDDKDA